MLNREYILLQVSGRYFGSLGKLQEKQEAGSNRDNRSLEPNTPFWKVLSHKLKRYKICGLPQTSFDDPIMTVYLSVSRKIIK